MCGITAFLSLGQHPALDRAQTEDEIHQSLDIVKHRGPDAAGKWISEDSRVGFGHVRLSIVDLRPEANQPFHDPEDDVYAIVNGELYDHERYRSELSAEYNFRSHSDCEIVLALYKHYGVSFLSHLRGEFAIVLWDAKREVFLATRDRYGVKSLYYTVIDGRLLVATEVKQFLAYGWQPEWDVRALVEVGWTFDDRTMFRGVKKIQPSEYIMSRNYGEIKREKYWDLQYPDKSIQETRTEEEMIEGVRQRLLDAVRVRLRADVPVGIYLSGGIDSSAIAGMVVHLVKEGAKLGDSSSQDLSRIQCFTVQFDKDSGADESDIAQRTAEFLGVKFNPIHVTEEIIAQRFEDTVWYSEAFAADTNGMGKLAMAEVTHDAGFKVVITGEGSDEHFAGYSFFQRDFMLEPDQAWLSPSYTPEKHTLAAEAARKAQFYGFKIAIPPILPSTQRTLNNTQVSSLTSRTISLRFADWTADQEKLKRNDTPTVFAESVDGQARENMMRKWHPLHTSEYTWTKTGFSNILLRYLGDNVDMAYQVESRPAFLDHNLTEYVNGLPPSLKLKYDYDTGDFKEKYILREAVKPFVTDEIYNRTKKPYMGPLRFPVNGPLHTKLAGLVTRENVESLGFVDWDQTKGLVPKAFEEGDHLAFRASMAIAQFVVISKRFGVKTAVPDAWLSC